MVVRIEDLELGRDVDVSRDDLAGRVLVETDLDFVELPVKPADQLLEIEDDVGDVFLHALDGRELVRHPLDLDGADSCALERREQDPAQRVAERMPEAAVERFDLEARPVARELLARDVGHLKL